MLAVMYTYLHMIKASLHVYCAMHSVSLYCLLVTLASSFNGIQKGVNLTKRVLPDG